MTHTTLQEILENNIRSCIDDPHDKTIQEAIQAIEKWIRDGIGEDLPLDQPFDEDMDTVTLASNKIFRKGANWARAEIKQRLLGDK